MGGVNQFIVIAVQHSVESRFFLTEMGKRRSSDVSPGKAGIGHKIKKPKKPKNPLKGLKAFGCKKITDFLGENSQLMKPLKIEGARIDKSARKALGEVGNISDTASPRGRIEKLKTPKTELKQEESDSEIVQEINEIFEKYQTNSTADLANLQHQSKVDEVEIKLEEPEDEGEMDGMSEYEKIGHRNIKERQQMFAQLQIEEAKRECSPASTPKSNKPQKRIIKPKEKIERRKSLRIAGGVPEIVRFSASFDDHPVDSELVSRPRRSLPENYNDYLHATRTFTGCERPDGLVSVEEGRFKILQVLKKCTIKQFVLSNNLEFKCGRGFYEFTKPEIISHKKEVVLVEKSSGKMFTGRDACRMIGAGSGIRIPPTAFETWRVFVQSTSYGRNLMGGTGFLYEV